MTPESLSIYDNNFLSEAPILSYKPYIPFYPEVNLDGSINIESSIPLYLAWLKRDDYILLKDNNSEKDYLAIQIPKRGNKTFMSRVYEKTHRLYEITKENIDFKIFDEQSSYGITSVLWVTLTWDTSLCSRDSAWCCCGVDLNNFFSSIRQKYGSFSIVRVFEAYVNGYPHIHILLFFHNQNFLVHKRYSRKQQKYIFRCDDDVNDFFHSCWHSHVDLQGVYGFKPILYLLKYVVKTSYYLDPSIEKGKGVKTAMLCTWFGKRQFAISSDLPERLLSLISQCQNNRLDKYKHNSNIKNIVETKKYQIVGVLTIFNVNKRILRLDGLPNSTDSSKILDISLYISLFQDSE